MDREKVIKEYEDFVKSFSKRNDTYYKSLFNSVLALLKEQETIVRCKDCKHRPYNVDLEKYESGFDLDFPDNVCPCQNSEDGWYSYCPDDDWFCPRGERK